MGNDVIASCELHRHDISMFSVPFKNLEYLAFFTKIHHFFHKLKAIKWDLQIHRKIKIRSLTSHLLNVEM